MSHDESTSVVNEHVVRAASLGSAAFRKTHGLRYAYLAGSMYKGIASADMVIAMGRAGLMGFLGTGGMKLDQIDADLRRIQSELAPGQARGANLLHHPGDAQTEDRLVTLLLRHGVGVIEASAFMQITPSLVRYRLAGARRRADGGIDIPHRVLAKVSRPEVAEMFLRPASPAMLAGLVAAGHLSAEEAEIGALVPVASELCAEADSGGHTDQGVAFTLLPAMLFLRDRIVAEQGYRAPIAVGSAGGLGTPQAVAAAFTLGADFVTTGSINQCTVEAGTSDAVKDMLQTINVQDTDYAPAGDMFELGAQVQVMRKGVFFPARARKLHELYLRHESLDELSAKTRQDIEERYFRRSFEAVWAETKAHYDRVRPDVIREAERHPKQKMALVFRWYFVHSTRLAMSGDTAQKVDFQVHCGPALGAFNQWVKGSPLEHWRNRHVAALGERLMQGAAEVMTARLHALMG